LQNVRCLSSARYDLSVTDEAPTGIDASKPNTARMYDYMLGGCFL
jgi:hypothetical protein